MSNDRNEKARQQFAAAQAKRQFIQALASGQTGVLDRFGTIVAEGDSILFIAPATGYIWQVKAIDAVDPRIPPGQVRITLVSEVQEIVPVGRPLREMLRVLTKQGAVSEALSDETAESQVVETPPVEPPWETPGVPDADGVVVLNSNPAPPEDPRD